MIEYEMKFEVSHESFREILSKFNAQFIKTITNMDYYYNHPIRDFATTDEALRVRRSEDTIKLTYKGPKFDDRSKSRKELDIGIEDIRIMDVLDSLGFKTSGVVKKVREVWQLEQYTITLDNVENLGEFVEIEVVYPHKIAEEEKIRELSEFAQKLDLNPDNQILKSYMELVQGL